MSEHSRGGHIIYSFGCGRVDEMVISSMFVKAAMRLVVGWLPGRVVGWTDVSFGFLRKFV